VTRIYNDPASFKDDMVAGLVSAYSRYLVKVPDASGVMRAGGPRAGKVSVVIGGGSGHYPAFAGVVGSGFADGAVIGDVFTSPSMEQAYRVARALDGGAGILFSFGNYAGDVMNFGAAEERLRAEGIDCRTVLVTDDVASAVPAEAAKRRGIAGDFCVFKIAGAAADRGDSLDRVEELARRANANTFSFGVAFAGCTFPGQPAPLFTVEPGRMDFGLGIHGEPGVRSVEWLPAGELAAALVEPVLAERPADTGGRAAVLLNGLGATKYEELFVLWKDVSSTLAAAGVEVVLPEVGELVTSLDMAGCSLTVCWLDEELEELWAAPTDTPAFRRGDVGALPMFAPVADAKAAGADEVTGVDASPESLRAAATARVALAAMLDVVTTNEAELARIDAVAGDGDHGTGMTRGLRAATRAADSAHGGVGSVLRAAGAAWGDRAGGTSGMLWGVCLQAIGDALGDVAPVSDERLAVAVRRGAETMMRVGKASLGDKTMLDSLFPFVEAYAERVASGEPDAWARAADIATDAAAATAGLAPKVGRARPLAERSLGTPDAGATSMALCLVAVGDILKQQAGGERA
jgi:dihydroxyacetone kinase